MQYFESFHCPATNCVITRNATYLPRISDFDVIALNSWNVPSIGAFPPPETRHKDQIYVMNYRESPIRTKASLREFSTLINWTMAFRLDADVNLAYGEFLDLETNGIVAPALRPAWRRPNYQTRIVTDAEVISIVEGKGKMAAWFVSSCYSPWSERLKLVKKIQEFMPVDVYGKCGSLECAKERTDSCREMVQRDYKFYFAFENSLCKDYVTEKVYETMTYYVIPVVYGGADYNRFLPPGSFINVQDFDSVQELVEYLQFLSSNRQEYMRYFWWKDYYRVRPQQHFCGLCEKISKAREGPVKVSKFYTDLDGWFKNGTCVMPSSIPLMDKVLQEYKGMKVKKLS